MKLYSTIDRELWPLTQKKKGSLEDGKDASHIFSFEVLNSIMSKSGLKYPLNVVLYIIQEVNNNSNLQIKSKSGNRVLDRTQDSKIIKSILDETIEITNKKVVKRIEKAWEEVEKMNLPKELKEKIREHFSKIKGENGQVIIRKNAKLGKIWDENPSEKVIQRSKKIKEKIKLEKEGKIKEKTVDTKKVKNYVEKSIESSNKSKQEQNVYQEKVYKPQTSQSHLYQQKEYKPQVYQHEKHVYEQKPLFQYQPHYQPNYQEHYQPHYQEHYLQQYQQLYLQQYQQQLLKEQLQKQQLQQQFFQVHRPEYKTYFPFVQGGQVSQPGLKFYKGGQFVPGGGRAPKGGGWY